MTEEEAKAMQEKLKNMSPEELKEFQKQQCIFCQIIAGKVQSKKIFEDDKCLAVLDINPANPGHVVLMPKEHYAIMPLIPEEELGHLAMVSKSLSHVLLNSLKAEGTNIFIANGIAAGQRAQHFMIHIIPRKEGDGVGMNIPENNFSKDQIVDMKKKINERITALLGKQKEVVDLEETKKEVEKKLSNESEEEQPEEKEQPKVKQEKKQKPKKKKPKGSKPQTDLEKELDEDAEEKPEEKEETPDEESDDEPDDEEQDDQSEEKEGANLDDISRLFQ